MPKRIMIVDDDENIRTVLRRMLSMGGYEVSEFEDGKPAYEAIRQEIEAGLGLVITDIIMPKMDGIDLARKIKQDYPLLPILAITGNANNIRGQDRLYFKKILSKPLTLACIRENLEEYFT